MQSEANNITTPLGTDTLFYWSIAQNLVQPAQLLLVDHDSSSPRRFASESGLSVISLKSRCVCSCIENAASEHLSGHSSMETEQLTQFDFYLGELEETIVPQRNILAGFCLNSALPFTHKVVTIDSHFNSLKNLRWIHLHDPHNIENILLGAGSVLANEAPIVTFTLAEHQPSTGNTFHSLQHLLHDLGYTLYDTDFKLASLKSGSDDNIQVSYLAIKIPGDCQTLIDDCRASVAPYQVSSD